jgi:hypothetical protein
VTSWTILYEDRTRFTSEDGPPSKAPSFGVLAIAQPEVDYRDLVFNERFYLYRSDRGYWSGHDLIGLVDQLAFHFSEIGGFLVGRDTANSEMTEAVRRLGLEARGR